MEITEQLRTHDGQTLAVYTRGNRENPAVVFLHGGPGGSISEKSFSFFDLTKWFVIAFDQRGCGQSKPFATLVNNTPFTGVEDLEMIRRHYGLESWIVFGGSYGSTLALLYAIKHPNRVSQLVLRGIFLGRKSDIDWLYQEGASYFYPEEHEAFKAVIAPDKRHDLISAYYHVFTKGDDEQKRLCAKAWSTWESSLVHLVPKAQDLEISDGDISLATLECHFFANNMFWDDDQYILNHIECIQSIPTEIVHGRYDVDCRPSGAYALAQKLDQVQFHLVEASGHSPYEDAMFNKLVEVMKNLENK
ncbi:prolyl aminopeptidase [Erysipelothrix rhusiopathiae]|uniref:prolyl aminopeptidase n=1 Tax=Erysipelothrix sp. strain 2 (EsS2-7-Brazil) TaxID=2500579 RepID=UPI001377829D|nr:prolyl aminopeptidase [Erysipelothrix sp. strain 2 (EsS2-7-Brazil)]MBK2403286.1 prolyl aminopeptidase [Erysipelothrix sp. strain 2 (EsS2-7-Brazil)]NBA00746.1 prolyl aminopeptidase [Erysipelothrix rhusiopathiae]